MMTSSRSARGFALLALLLTIACVDDGADTSPDGTGGTPPSGTGGASAATGGESSAGGAATTGGAPTTGGATGTGGATTCTDLPDGVELEELGRTPRSGSSLGVIAYRVAYTSTDGTRVQGQMCLPDSPGPHPIVVHNHGGVQGIGISQWGPIPGNLCHGTASGGILLVEPQYRGTVDQGLNATLGPIDIRSEGRVEFCAGEIEDSLALMRIAQRRCDVNPNQVAMWGESHGACITLAAASRHPEGLRAAATLVAPIDLVAGYEYNAARVPGGPVAPEPGCDPVADHQYISAGFEALFGTPASSPEGYRARSAIHLANELAVIPLLQIYGVDDCLIQPLSAQGCAMRDALVQAGAHVVASHLDADGQPTTTELPGCSPMNFEATWPPTGGFTADHHVVFGDGQGHQLEGPARAKELQAIREFFLAHAITP